MNKADREHRDALVEALYETHKALKRAETVIPEGVYVTSIESRADDYASRYPLFRVTVDFQCVDHKSYLELQSKLREVARANGL